MITWEYSSILNEGPATRETLNGLGGDRWELVSVIQGAQTHQLLYVFKRPTEFSVTAPPPPEPAEAEKVTPIVDPGQSVF